jgi:hypothetical protein
MAVVRPPLKVVGGITYRPFLSRKFAEIVFCAIASSEQVKVRPLFVHLQLVVGLPYQRDMDPVS